MNQPEIIIIGAGAAGLMAARELSHAGKQVIILEAAEKCGGRINTVTPEGFPRYIDEGAEFIHGNSKLTYSLLKQAGINIKEMSGKSFRYNDGKLEESEEFIKDFPELIKRLKRLKEDIPFSDFLLGYFSEPEFEESRESIKKFVSGYDAADIHKISSFALRDEFSSEQDEHRPEGGYGMLIDFLVRESKQSGTAIYTSHVVKEIHWEKDRVKIICENGEQFLGKKIIITASLGVLKAQPREEGHIQFFPDIPGIKEAAAKLGYGTVIKIFIAFKENFWEEKFGKVGFLMLQDELFNVWWSQLPDNAPVLTGWIGGPAAEKLRLSSEEIVNRSISLFAQMFITTEALVKDQLEAHYVCNWKEKPFIQGGYSYNVVGGGNLKKTFLQPKENTIYFAGEALYEGNEMGTVEAALVSGQRVARKIISDL